MNNKRQIKLQKPLGLVKVLTSLSVILIIGIGIIISGNNYYDNLSIIGKWRSKETGIKVEFTDHGIVKVNNVKTGKYIINSPDSMVYQIDGHDFEMNYQVDGRNLVWGLVDESEKFARNGL